MGGEFGAFCEPRPRSVRVNGEPVAFTHDEHGLLRVDMPPSGEALELSVEFPKAHDKAHDKAHEKAGHGQ